MQILILIVFFIPNSFQYSFKFGDTRLILDPYCGRSSSSRLFNNSQKIINGDRVPLGAYPWLINIYTETDLSLTRFCSGTLISDMYVLTAAHCVRDRKLSQLKIGYGHTNYEKMYINNWSRKVSDIILNDQNKDIALLRLESGIDLSDRSKVSTICLPPNVDTRVVFGKEVVVAGWGSTNGKKSDPTKTADLFETTLTIDTRCSLFNDFYCLIDLKNDGRESNSCYGDSGTPAMYYDNMMSRWYAYGVLSLASVRNSICQPNEPSFHVKVPEFLRWIRDSVY